MPLSDERRHAGTPRRVTALASPDGAGERWVVRLDDGRRLRVDAEEAARCGLAAGEVVEPRLVARLEARDGYLRARDRALRLLAIRPRSAAELRSRLMRYRIPPGTLRAVIADLDGRGYLDDLAFAKTWIAARLASRAYGVGRIRWELRQKGVPAAVIGRAVREAFEVDPDLAAAEERSASALVRRRLPACRRLSPAQRTRRIAAMLERRGFAHATIIRALRAIGEVEAAERFDG